MIWRAPALGSLRGEGASALVKIFESLTQWTKQSDERFAALEQRVTELENQ